MVGSFNNNKETSILNEGLAQLGLESDRGKLLYFVKDKDSYAHEPSIWFQLELAGLYLADAVFFKKGIRENEYIPQIYIYDKTDLPLADTEDLTEIHKKVWTGGEVPLVCVFSKTEIKILDTTKPIEEDTQKNVFKPVYLFVKNLKDVAVGHKIFNEHFAQKLKSGTYWDNSDVNFDKNSSYSQLTALLKRVINKFTKESGLENKKEIVQKLIIQCILVKYLEERRDENDNRVFPSSYFHRYGDSEQFSDVLKKGLVFDFFTDLNTNHFNGGIFKWDDDQKILFAGKQSAFDYLADVLRGYMEVSGQQKLEFPDNFSRLYAFNYIPVELISRLYEEFIIKREQESKDLDNSKKKNDGVAYTPSHLVRLLVNEAMPLNKVPDNLDDFKVLDPACGSAIFLVVAYKRLVQWWRQNNNYTKPKIKDLMKLLDSVYGVDLDPKAVQISIFSLCIALCDELSPKEIWDNLKFDNLEGRTVFCKDFFEWKEEWLKKENNHKFNVVIGNPPFVRGGLNKKQRTWIVNNMVVEIPQKQIALKFLCESLFLLKDNGNSCLIVKALPLLYSNSDVSKKYLKALICNYQVNQIFDFTPLARNKSLWDGTGKVADVSVAAIFITKRQPDFNKNILHAIFRRTKVNKERIYFEIDKYDLNFVLCESAYTKDSFIFKINLMGGGRLKNIIHKLRTYPLLKEYEKKNICIIREGHGTLTKIKENPTSISEKLKSNKGIIDGAVVNTENISYGERIRITDSQVYYAPTLLISETINLEKKSIMAALTDRNLVFKNRYVGIHSIENDKEFLISFLNDIKQNELLYVAYLLSTSAQIYVNLNTSIYCEDIKELPVLNNNFKLNKQEEIIIQDVLTYIDEFIRHENPKAIKPIMDKSINSEIDFYGKVFAQAINELYADNNNSFKLTDIIKFEKENLIGALFSYDERKNIIPQYRTEKEASQIDGLINFDINESLTATRIIQYYTTNKVLFVKPNQKRYWLASIAYRDADSVFADILINQ